MSVFDRLLNTVRLNDDYDDDFYDEDDTFEEEDEKEVKEPKVNSRFSKKMDDDDFDDLDDEPVAKPKKKKFGKDKSSKAEKAETPSYSRNSKITPIKKKAGTENMEVCVIKPTSMEETKEIVDTLRDNCTVVLNLEGMDVETAQRIIDFVSGASYGLDGTLRMVSSFIFILTPDGVEITGDIQDILGDAAPNIRTEF